MAPTMWMVRAGEGGWRFDAFERESLVSIGWPEMGDFSGLQSRDDIYSCAEKIYPEGKKSWLPSAVGQIFRFVREIKVGDSVVSYSQTQRLYLVGKVTSEYRFAPDNSPEQPSQRSVSWRGKVSRDALTVSTRNSLGSISTLFTVTAEAAAEIEAALVSQTTTVELLPAQAIESTRQVDDLYKDIQAKAFEFIKDKVNQLDWDDMQELVAGLLRAMGYKTRVSPSGPDRGKDIIASPDGLGFENPRIVVEVKHRTASMGSQEIRSFLGGRHDNDKGLYVSTGGFTKDARYEAERGRIPLTLMDLDDLVKSLLEHYEKMDIDMQRLIPLRKLYWPA